MWKVANLDPQYHGNMVPLIFVQESGHFSVFLHIKSWNYVIFIEKSLIFDPCFGANQQVCEFAPKWPIQFYLRPVL